MQPYYYRFQSSGSNPWRVIFPCKRSSNITRKQCSWSGKGNKEPRMHHNFSFDWRLAVATRLLDHFVNSQITTNNQLQLCQNQIVYLTITRQSESMGVVEDCKRGILEILLQVLTNFHNHFMRIYLKRYKGHPKRMTQSKARLFLSFSISQPT